MAEHEARPCCSEIHTPRGTPDPGDHAIPSPGAATHDLLPAAVDLPGLPTPVPPPFPLRNFPPPPPGQE